MLLVLLTLPALVALPAAALPSSPALPAFPAPAACTWAANAPDQHRVQRGDTLWGIASVFLKDPWCWPQVWENNRDSIRDPHWIYPGQVILLDRVRGVLRVADGDRRDLPLRRLSPMMRTHALDAEHLPVLPVHLLQVFARSPLLETRTLALAPTVVRLPEHRSLAADHDVVLVRGEPGSQPLFDVIRPSAPINDPDSKELLGRVGVKVGQARLLSRGTLTHRFLITASTAEVQSGDMLVSASAGWQAPVSIGPSTAPAGKLAAVLHEGRWAGPNDLVAINRGSADGMRPGNVVRVVQPVRIRADDEMQPTHAPEDSPPVAFLLVFTVAERVSLAVVMRSRDTIAVGDAVLPP